MYVATPNPGIVISPIKILEFLWGLLLTYINALPTFVIS
jgi:hypothetical protein